MPRRRILVLSLPVSVTCPCLLHRRYQSRREGASPKSTRGYSSFGWMRPATEEEKNIHTSNQIHSTLFAKMSERETTMEGGGTACYCRAAVTSLARKLTQLMDSRPAARDALQELSTDDEHVAAWKMILEMAYGVQDWVDPKVAGELGKPETERKRIQEIQAEISAARARCRLRSNRLLDDEAAPNSDADHVDADGTNKCQDDAAPSEAAVDNGREMEKTVAVSGDSASGSASSSSPPVRCRRFSPAIQSTAASSREEPAATAHQFSSSTTAATTPRKKPGAASRVVDSVPWLAGDRPRDASYASTEGEEVVEEFFGELWAVPACHFKAAANKQRSSSNWSRLVWIRRDLFVARTFTAEDCYPARASDRLWRLPVPRDFSFSYGRCGRREGEQVLRTD